MEYPYPDHKLCGYLSTVVALRSPQPYTALPFLSPCCIFSDGIDIAFKAGNSVVLSAITNATDYSPPLKLKNGDIGNSTAGKRRFKRGIGMVNGSLSVVHQIHALVANKCIQLIARVLKVEVRGREVDEARVAVLVDLYLPFALWTGWQFPKSGSIAGALSHLSLQL